MYGLNVSRLAFTEAAKQGDPSDSAKPYWDFLSSPGDFFSHGFPVGRLQFIPFPGKGNTRMQRQFGCFLYDTQGYSNSGPRDLEDYLEKLKEVQTVGPDGSPVFAEQNVLYKIRINQGLASEIFARLELMNMNGGHLLGDADGVAQDVINAYNFNPKFSYLRDIKLT